MQTAGRAGVGRSTVAEALTACEIAGVVIEESDAVDVPDAPDPVLDADLVIYLLVESVRDADREAVRTLEPARVLQVLNKSDTVGESRAPGDVWSSAVARASDCAVDGGFATLPLIGWLANAGTPSESDLVILRTSPRDLEGRWGAYGVARARAALVANPALDAAGVGAALREASGIAALSAAVADRVERIRARRAEALLDALRACAAHSVSARDVVENYLAGDGAVAFAAEAARLHVGEWTSDALDSPRTAGDAIRCADWWRGQLSQQSSARQHRAVIDIRRHYIRLWQQLSGSRGA
ncbi:hypothetical protein BFN03_00715 [Rhodococcus sp. WMMA185]|nr:hypothetical protein BFN03_00715 [Rhodococcus sp. WMMA185]